MESIYQEFIVELYIKHYNQLLRRAYRAIGDAEKAKEMTQEVFLIAWLRAGALSEHPCPEGWLHKTLSHVINREKQRSAWVQVPLDDNLLAPEPIEKRQEIAALLPTSLSPEEKALLQWRFVDELSYEEIADRLGIAPAAVGMRLFRAKKHCRELLAADEK